ncbi:hypothetical protein HDU76_009632 [Blyttiomyces sp. JEL0837]|nr:hypothetical protein HDU76_009632 [Blyttiomyces sp. JEL0837]
MVRQDNVFNVATQQPAVLITHSRYDKRALTCTDRTTLSASLQNLNYLTSVNTSVMASLMAADGGLFLVIGLLKKLGRRINGLPEDEGAQDYIETGEQTSTKSSATSSAAATAFTLTSTSTSSSSSVPAPTSSSNVKHNPESYQALLEQGRNDPDSLLSTAVALEARLTSQKMSLKRTKSDNLDRLMYSNALATIANIAMKGRQKMKEALVENGLIPVLVELLEEVVSMIEVIQALQSAPRSKNGVETDSSNGDNKIGTVAQTTSQPTKSLSSADESNELMAARPLINEPTSTFAAATSSAMSSSALSVQPMTVDSTDTSRTNLSGEEFSDSNSEHGSLPVPGNAMQISGDQLQQQQGLQSETVREGGSSPEVVQMARWTRANGSINTHSRNITSEAQALVNGGNNIDSTGTTTSNATTTTNTATATATTTATGTGTTSSSSNSHEIPILPGVQRFPQTALEASLISEVIHRGVDILLASKIIASLSKYPSIRTHMHADVGRPNRPTLQAMILAARDAANGLSAHSSSAGKGIGSRSDAEGNRPSTTSTTADSGSNPMDISSDDEEQEQQPTLRCGHGPSEQPCACDKIRQLGLDKFEEYSDEMEEFLSQYGVGSSGPLVMPTPRNRRSAFELLEKFTSPSSFFAEVRMFAVVALRNAYRRDPAQANLPVVNVSGGGSGSNSVIRNHHHHHHHQHHCEGESVFVSPGQLRRCAYSSKYCQRRAWVLHKNWCLKFNESEKPAPAAATVEATVANLPTTIQQTNMSVTPINPLLNSDMAGVTVTSGEFTLATAPAGVMVGQTAQPLEFSDFSTTAEFVSRAVVEMDSVGANLSNSTASSTVGIEGSESASTSSGHRYRHRFVDNDENAMNSDDTGSSFAAASSSSVSSPASSSSSPTLSRTSSSATSSPFVSRHSHLQTHQQSQQQSQQPQPQQQQHPLSNVYFMDSAMDS